MQHCKIKKLRHARVKKKQFSFVSRPQQLHALQNIIEISFLDKTESHNENPVHQLDFVWKGRQLFQHGIDTCKSQKGMGVLVSYLWFR